MNLLNLVPNNWQEVQVKDICNLGRGRVISQEEIDNNPGSYPVYSSQTANEGIFGYLNTFDFEGEYVTWTTDGANAGTVFYRSGKFNCTNVCGTLKSDLGRVDTRFLAAALSIQAKKYVSYIGNPKLMNNVVAAIPLLLPPLPEQRRIAKILDTADAAIRQAETHIAKLKQIKDGLLHDLLTRGVDAEGRLRDPLAHPEQFKDSPLGRIPGEWEVARLETFAQKTKNSFVNGPFGSDLLASELRDEGIPIIYVRDVKANNYKRISTVCVSPKKAEELSFCSVRYGDVIVAKVGDPPCDAAPYLVSGNAIVTQDVIRIRPDENIDSQFLSNLINSYFGRRGVEKIAIEGTRKRVSLTEFKNMLLPKPPIKEQLKIGSVLSTHNALIRSKEDRLAKLWQVKQGLMHDLLVGWVRV